MTSWGKISDATCNAELLNAFQRCGSALFVGNLNNSHSGNMSVRDGDAMWITRTRSMCHDMNLHDIIRAPLDGSGDRSQLSRESVVHETIYNETGYEAVVHCHPRDAIAVSFLLDAIYPMQIEGHGALPGVIPVLEFEVATASKAFAANVAAAMKTYPAVMVRGHGLFVGGGSLDQATHRSFVVNDSAYFTLVAMDRGADIKALLAKPYLVRGYGAVASAAR
ncbi:MAG: class II aldolase/adducin family protein [Rhizobiaceae bacterium]|nr:class II aldolase/adducin family protein [Rhizobiaceae bacterium]